VALFIIRHQHSPERCPARDPFAGSSLLNHLSRANARQQGVHIQGEAVVDGEHSLFLIVEAPDLARVGSFFEPLGAAGRLNVYPASTCARVVASGGCASAMPRVDGLGPAMDPEEACQRAIEAGLVVHRAHPLNCETSIPALIGGAVMPNAHFYARNHFQIPLLDPASWRLEVRGLVDRSLSLTLRELQNMPSQSLVVTLECAGNGRSQLTPPVSGEPWRFGAVSTAEWTGVPLVEVLSRAGIQSAAKEVLFRGADGGPVEGRADLTRFERSLNVDEAGASQALLAYAMNGEPLPVQHGHPLRLIVPGWYAVASVKWLTEIELIGRAFSGHFQTDRYYYEWQRNGGVTREPVTLQRVRALITEPGPDSEREPGELIVRGVAWSGAAPIARVEVSIGGGPWQEARLLGERQRHSWQWWELSTRVDRPGTISLRARATDLAGRTQPKQPEWNRFGYGSNAIQEVAVRVG